MQLRFDSQKGGIVWKNYISQLQEHIIIMKQILWNRGMEVNLTKDPENEYDKEAIKVEMPGLGLVGFVANSPHTVKGESMSAGRLYDKIGDTAVGKILYVLPQGVLCEISEIKKEDADESRTD